jgi:7-keto-8-aminopelargonate synthetase-like enzyme
MEQQPAARYVMESLYGPEVVLSGRRYVNFGGCGYLGLHGHPEIVQAAGDALRKYGISSGLSRHYSVSSAPLLETEDKAAEFFGTESALYLPTGYLTAAVAAWGLADRVDAIFLDDVAHYSVRDAAVLTGKPIHRFAHCDPDDLRRKLKTNLPAGQKPLVMSDGVFPTFGEIAPVAEYLKAVEPCDGQILLDEAHSVGAVGPHGWGSFDHHGLASDRIHFGGTLSKAFGAHGGIIPGSRQYIERLRTCPIVRGASAPSAPCAAASAKSLEIVLQHPDLKERLWTNVRMLKDGLRGLGIAMNDTEVPIVTFALGSADATARMHQGLLDRGIFVYLSHYIGASAGGVLRHAVFANHTPQHIRCLLDAIKELL